MTITTNDIFTPSQAIHDHNMEEFRERSYDDELVGAILVSHLRQHCENCGTHVTPQWRKGWFSDVLNHSVLLCNACGLKFHKGQFCPYCKYVYGKEQRIEEIWLACDTCGRWVHRSCEAEHGGHQHDENFNCIDCRSGIVPNYFIRVSERQYGTPIESPFKSETSLSNPNTPSMEFQFESRANNEDISPMDSEDSFDSSSNDNISYGRMSPI